MVFLSPGYLSAVFKEETGVTLNRFIREVRMEKAKELLETTNMKISGIAKEVGFSNNSYFCRSFREQLFRFSKQTTVTPRFTGTKNPKHLSCPFT